jgi:hypothetical protein
MKTTFVELQTMGLGWVEEVAQCKGRLHRKAKEYDDASRTHSQSGLDVDADEGRTSGCAMLDRYPTQIVDADRWLQTQTGASPRQIASKVNGQR